MPRLIRSLLLVILLQASGAYAAGEYREMKWENLVPKGWDPARELKLLDFSKLQDSDARAIEALQRMKEMWDAAPTEPALEGTKIRIPGYAIPLERKGEQVREFLLVPYFGACIHSPPPPANQIIHAVSKQPLKDLKTMDTVWVTGTLGIQRADTPWGAAGYRLTVDRVAPYEETPRKKK